MTHRHEYPYQDIERKWRSTPGFQSTFETREADSNAHPQNYVFSWPANVAEVTGGAGRLGLWRRLLAADTLGRFEGHRGRKVHLPLAIDGFSPARSESSGPAGGQESVSSVVDRVRADAGVLGLSSSGPVISTADRAYYRFTQWLYLELAARGFLRSIALHCDVCQVCGQRCRRGMFGVCPRCGGVLEARRIQERRIEFGDLGDRLLAEVETSDRRVLPGKRPRTDWARQVAAEQRALLSRVRGCEVRFPVSRLFELEHAELVVFTTSVETLFGATFLLVDPYHPILEQVLDPACEDDLTRYRDRVKKAVEPRISAVRTGGWALNPATLKRIPILASVIANRPHSSGVLLGVPGHDAELFELAKRQSLPIREVIHNDKARFDSHTRLEQPWLGDGILTNSGPFSGLAVKVGRDRIVSALSRKGISKKCSRFRVANLPVTSRDGHGPPVPTVHCARCGELPLPESELPSEPRASASGRAVPATCPSCGGPAERDPETILPWLGNAWAPLALAIPSLLASFEGFRSLASGDAAPQASARASSSATEGSVLEPSGPTPEPGASPVAGADSVGSAALPKEAALVLPEDRDIFGVESTFEPSDGAPDTGALDPGQVDASTAAHVPPSSRPASALSLGPETAPAGERHPEDPGAVPGSESRGSGSTESAKSTQNANGTKREAGSPPPSPAPSPPPSGGEAAGSGSEGDEDDDDDVLPSVFRPSHLHPFGGDRLGALLPAGIALSGDDLRPKELLGLRLVAKVLKDAEQIGTPHLFSRFLVVGRASLVPGEVGDARPPEADPCAPSDPKAALRAAPPKGGARADEGVAPKAAYPTVKPDANIREIAEVLGADALRLSLLAAGPIDRPVVVSLRSVSRMRRLLARVWVQMSLRRERGKFISRRVLVEKHLLIHEVTRRLARGKFHTAVAALRRFVRVLEHPETKPEEMDRQAMMTFIVLLSPLAPFLARELWQLLGAEGDLESAPWPVPSEELVHPAEHEFPIFVDGRLRDRMLQPAQLEPEKLESRSLGREKIRECIGSRKVRRVIVVPRKLVNIVLEPLGAL